MRNREVTGPEPGGCTDGLRGRLARPSVQTPCLRLPRWLPLRGTRAAAVLFVLGDTQAPRTPSNAGQGALCRGRQPPQHLWVVGIRHKHATLRPRSRQPGDSGEDCQSSAQGSALELGHCPPSPAQPRLERGDRLVKGRSRRAYEKGL